MSAAPVPPQNLEAEESVLGACLLSSTKAVELVLDSGLEPEHFYRDSHGAIFAAIRDLYAAGAPVDPMTLVDALERRGELDVVGGRLRVHELAALVPAWANAGHWCGIVVENWKRRETIAALGAGLEKVWEHATADEALVEVERDLLELRSKVDRGKRTVVPMAEAMEWFGEKTENPPDDVPGIDGPFRFWPKHFPGRLTVVGGYTADGKSIIGKQCAKAAALGNAFGEDRRARVGVVTLEMSWQDFTDRFVTSYGVPYRQAHSGRIVGTARASASRAMAELRALEVDLIDDESADAAAIHRYQRLGRYDLLIVDHLHRIETADRADFEREVRMLSRLARFAEIPVILLSQLNRGSGSSTVAPRPTLASYRDSGVIEQEAALAAFIYRKRDGHGEPTDEAEFIVAKNRFGRTNSYPLELVAGEVRYREPGVERADTQEELGIPEPPTKGAT